MGCGSPKESRMKPSFGVAESLRKSEVSKFDPGQQAMIGAILYNQVSAGDSAGDLDVLRQCVAVEEAMRSLGWQTTRIPCTLNLSAVRDSLTATSPELVFNLVESLGRTDRMMPAATLLLESMGIPFTGSGSLAILTTTNKVTAKECLRKYQIPTPAWLARSDDGWQGTVNSSFPEAVIVKATAEHASLGITDHSVIRGGDLPHIMNCIRRQEEQHHTKHFAEQFIEGREFNLSLLASEKGPVVLPPAEIQFLEFPADKPKIVGHNAKWDDLSMESVNTPRRFDFPSSDRPLLDELSALARRCWSAFQLRGYARVDFRVDMDGQPWVLEVNANPCLSADAGFAAAVSRAGLSFQAAIQHILADSRC